MSVRMCEHGLDVFPPLHTVPFGFITTLSRKEVTDSKYVIFDQSTFFFCSRFIKKKNPPQTFPKRSVFEFILIIRVTNIIQRY